MEKVTIVLKRITKYSSHWRHFDRNRNLDMEFLVDAFQIDYEQADEIVQHLIDNIKHLEKACSVSMELQVTFHQLGRYVALRRKHPQGDLLNYWQYPAIVEVDEFPKRNSPVDVRPDK